MRSAYLEEQLKSDFTGEPAGVALARVIPWLPQIPVEALAMLPSQTGPILPSPLLARFVGTNGIRPFSIGTSHNPGTFITEPV